MIGLISRPPKTLKSRERGLILSRDSGAQLGNYEWIGSAQ